METERLDEIIEELSIAKENLLSFRDNYLSNRFRKATSDLYFGFEHIAKALLLSAGIRPETHKGVSRMLSYHFVKAGIIPVQVVIHLDNLYERRKIAEYSSRAGWEFTKDQLDSYRQSAISSVRILLDEIKKSIENRILQELEEVLQRL